MKNLKDRNNDKPCISKLKMGKRTRNIIILSIIVIALTIILLVPRKGVMAIDVSHHNKGVKAKIEKFQPRIIIAKASEGTNFKDPKFKEYFKMSVENKLWFGAYHFFSFDKDVKRQFRNYLETVKLRTGGCPEYRIDVKPILDVETNPGKRNPGYFELRRKVREFGKLCFEEFGCYPIIYCNEAYRLIYFLFGFEDYVFWTRNTVTNPLLPSAMHQYKEDKANNLDLNRVYDLSKIMRF